MAVDQFTQGLTTPYIWRHCQTSTTRNGHEYNKVVNINNYTMPLDIPIFCCGMDHQLNKPKLSVVAISCWNWALGRFRKTSNFFQWSIFCTELSRKPWKLHAHEFLETSHELVVYCWCSVIELSRKSTKTFCETYFSTLLHIVEALLLSGFETLSKIRWLD